MNLLKAFFGGGSTVAYVVLFAIVGGVWLKYDLTMKDNTKLKADNERLEEANIAKDGTIASQARQGNRKAQAGKDLDNAESNINQVPDSNKCAGSEPIIIALDQLRVKQSGDQTDNPD